MLLDVKEENCMFTNSHICNAIHTVVSEYLKVQCHRVALERVAISVCSSSADTEIEVIIRAENEEQYKQEARQFNNIVKRFEMLQETDIVDAYSLMKDSLQAYNRWSKIKQDIKKDLRKGEMASLKERLEEMCKYLKEVHTVARMTWKCAKDDLKVHKEDI